jgi:hypothetical protein
MESNEILPPSPAGKWLKIAYILWIIFAIAVCGVIVAKAFMHPQEHLGHTVYPILAEGSVRWWSDLPLHGYIKKFDDIYRYSPTFAILFSPFASLPEWLGACLWGLLSIGAFVGAMRVMARELLPGSWSIDRQGVFLGLTLVGASAGIWSGQSNALLIAAVIFAMQAIKRERWWMASFLLAFPVFIKLWPLAVVMLLAACWPKQLIWRFVLVAVAFALFPFLTRPPTVVIGQYQEWYESLTGLQHDLRWPGYRDAWTIWEGFGKIFHWQPSWPSRGFQALQLTSSVAVLGWCLWQKRRLEKKNTRGTGLSTPFFTYPVGNLLTAILSMWVIWQLLFGPGSEQITYGIIAPSAAWAVMVSFQQRKNHGENGLAKLKTLFQRGWTILAWLILGLFGMGDIEHPLVKLHPAAIMLLPLGLIMFGIWLVIYDFTDQDSRDLPGLPSP